MGIVLDSSAVIAAERASLPVARFLERIARQAGNQPAVLSAISYAELAHGVYRTKTDAQRMRRQAFVSDLTLHLAVYPFTREAAEIAAKVGAQAIAEGLTIPYADLLIGSTALSLGYALFTGNERHFRLIPDLDVIADDLSPDSRGIVS